LGFLQNDRILKEFWPFPVLAVRKDVDIVDAGQPLNSKEPVNNVADKDFSHISPRYGKPACVPLPARVKKKRNPRNSPDSTPQRQLPTGKSRDENRVILDTSVWDSYP